MTDSLGASSTSTQLADIVELEQLLARYAVALTRDDVEGVRDVFAPDGTYTAFGGTYAAADLPAYLGGAPKGLVLPSTPLLEIDGDDARGQQVMCFVDQTTHDMRMGYWTDTYRRTEQGWRIQSRTMTFLRRSGAHDGGKQHPNPPKSSVAGTR
jgi:hypothetical protein